MHIRVVLIFRSFELLCSHPWDWCGYLRNFNQVKLFSNRLIQTEAERRMCEAGVIQWIEKGVRACFPLYLCRGERGTSVHGADTFTAVFGKTIGRLCSRKCRSIPSLADNRSTYIMTKCLLPDWRKSQICVSRVRLKLILKHYFS